MNKEELKIPHILVLLKQVKETFSNINDGYIVDCTVGYGGHSEAIISFHSLEDRIVKKTFKLWTQSCICPAGIMRCECGNNHSLGKIVTKKPIIPTKEEEKINPRSRSSKMRVFKLK